MTFSLIKMATLAQVGEKQDGVCVRGWPAGAPAHPSDSDGPSVLGGGAAREDDSASTTTRVVLERASGEGEERGAASTEGCCYLASSTFRWMGDPCSAG